MVIALGCGGDIPAVVGSAEPEDPTTPFQKRASHYGGEQDPVLLEPAEEFIWSNLPSDVSSCTLDPRLVLAARKHSRDILASGIGAGGDIDHLRFSLEYLGGFDYALAPFVPKMGKDIEKELQRHVMDHQGEWTHCGLGLASVKDRTIAVWIGVRRGIDIDPVPVTPSMGQVLAVRGRVAVDGMRISSSFLGLPDGTVRKLDTARIPGSNDFEVRISFDRPGRHELELQTENGCGPETTVLLPLYVDVDPDVRPIIVLTESKAGDRHSPEEILAQMINSARSKANLPALVIDQRLEAVARSHTMDMVALGYFGHQSPDVTLLEDRLSNRGLAPSSSAENVARSHDITRAHRNLMRSPSHRLNTMSREFTHMGVAVEQDDDSVVVTVVFARW